MEPEVGVTEETN